MTKEYPCPFCKAEFDTIWQLENHVRISAGEHGPKYTIPDGFKVGNSQPNPATEEKQTLETNVSQTPDLNVIKGPQDGDLTNVQKITPPITKPVLRCPECGSSKEDWISINADHDYNVTEEMKKEYDFICTECRELIKVRE